MSTTTTTTTEEIIDLDPDKKSEVPKSKKGLVKRLSKEKGQADPKKQQEKEEKATENYEAQIQAKKDKATKVITKVKEAQDRAKSEETKQESSIESNYLRIGDIAPDFTHDSTDGELNWHTYINGKWAILFSHPKDFTPVCTTEIVKVGQLKRQWTKRNTVVATISVDKSQTGAEWIKEANKSFNAGIDFPIFGDEDRKISVLYGMLDPSNINDTGLPLTVRSVFIIGPDKKIKAVLTYPASTGRSYAEVIRLLDSIQLHYYRGVITPEGWERGDDVMLSPKTSEEKGKEMNCSVINSKCKMRSIPDPMVSYPDYENDPDLSVYC